MRDLNLASNTSALDNYPSWRDFPLLSAAIKADPKLAAEIITYRDRWGQQRYDDGVRDLRTQAIREAEHWESFKDSMANEQHVEVLLDEAAKDIGVFDD